jgi:hypothetical protein
MGRRDQASSLIAFAVSATRSRVLRLVKGLEKHQEMWASPRILMAT